MKEKVLFISKHVPSPDIPQAGHKLAYQALSEYCKIYDVYLIACVNDDEEKYLNPERFGICAEYRLIKCSRISKAISIISHFWLPIQSATRINSEVIRQIRLFQKNNKFVLYNFEFSEAAPLKRFCNRDAKWIITVHDVIFQSLQRKSRNSSGIRRLMYGFEAYRQKKWEATTYADFNVVQVLTNKDKSLLCSIGIQPEKIGIVYPMVDEKYYNVKRMAIERKTVLFFAAFNRPENVDAAQWLIQEIIPEVIKIIPDIKFYLVGAFAPVSLLKHNSKNIIVTGFVADPLPYFEKCEIAIAPLRLGAGIKIKILEYIAAKMPVATTDIGAEGIQSDFLCVVNTSEAFAGEIVKRCKENTV